MRRAILIEDDPELAPLLRGTLRRLGWTVRPEDVHDEWLPAFRSWETPCRPRLLVIDQHLNSSLKGADVLGLIRDTHAGEETAVVVISGHEFGPTLRKTVRENGGVFLSKPISHRSMSEAIARAEDARRYWTPPAPPETQTQTFRRLRAAAQAG